MQNKILRSKINNILHFQLIFKKIKQEKLKKKNYNLKESFKFYSLNLIYFQ